MKYRIFAVVLSLVLLCGCTAERTPAESQMPEETLQTFGQMPENAEPVQAAQTTAAVMPTRSPAAEAEAPAAPTGMPEEQETVSVDYETEAVLTALILLRETDGLSYDGSDPVSILRGFGYLTGLMRGQDSRIAVSGTEATVTKSTAEEYVYGLFGAFDGVFPAVPEEDPLVKSAGGKYRVNLVELGDLKLQVSDRSEKPDGTISVTATLTMEGKALPGYIFTLTDFKGKSNVFPYSVTAMERAG